MIHCPNCNHEFELSGARPPQGNTPKTNQEVVADQVAEEAMKVITPILEKVQEAMEEFKNHSEKQFPSEKSSDQTDSVKVPLEVDDRRKGVMEIIRRREKEIGDLVARLQKLYDRFD